EVIAWNRASEYPGAPMRTVIVPRRASRTLPRRLLQFVQDQRKHILRGRLSDEYIKVTVIPESIERMEVLAEPRDVGVRSHLALGQEASAPLAGEEHEAGRGLRRTRGVIVRQPGQALVRHQPPEGDASGHLPEERERDVGELPSNPIVRL